MKVYELEEIQEDYVILKYCKTPEEAHDFRGLMVKELNLIIVKMLEDVFAVCLQYELGITFRRR